MVQLSLRTWYYDADRDILLYPTGSVPYIMEDDFKTDHIGTTYRYYGDVVHRTGVTCEGEAIFPSDYCIRIADPESLESALHCLKKGQRRLKKSMTLAWKSVNGKVQEAHRLKIGRVYVGANGKFLCIPQAISWDPFYRTLLLECEFLDENTWFFSRMFPHEAQRSEHLYELQDTDIYCKAKKIFNISIAPLLAIMDTLKRDADNPFKNIDYEKESTRKNRSICSCGRSPACSQEAARGSRQGGTPDR